MIAHGANGNTPMTDDAPQPASERILAIIGEDADDFVTDFVVVANCVNKDGDSSFYYLTPYGQRMPNTLGLLESGAATVKSRIVSSWNTPLTKTDEANDD